MSHIKVKWSEPYCDNRLDVSMGCYGEIDEPGCYMEIENHPGCFHLSDQEIMQERAEPWNHYNCDLLSYAQRILEGDFKKYEWDSKDGLQISRHNFIHADDIDHLEIDGRVLIGRGD